MTTPQKRTLTITCGNGEVVERKQHTCFVSNLIADISKEKPLIQWQRSDVKDGINYHSTGLAEGTFMTLRELPEKAGVEFTYRRQGKVIYTAVEKDGDVSCNMHLAHLLHKVTCAVTMAEVAQKPGPLAEPMNSIRPKPEPKEHTINLEITNDPNVANGLTPPEIYAKKLQADAQAGFKEYQWDTIPNDEHPCSPTFLIIDDTEGLVSYLCQRKGTDKFDKYLLTTTKVVDCSVLYSSMEMVSAAEPNSILRDIYIRRAEYLMEQVYNETAKADAEEPADTTADREVALTNDFVDALIRDVQGERHRVHFVRKCDGFFADSFGISESSITLTKEWADNESARFFIKLEKPDGTLVLSMAETSKHTDDEAELRKLYRLLDEQLPIVTVDTACEDVRRYVESSTLDAFFEKILAHAQPELHAIESADEEGKVLIYDLFNNVCETSVIRQFLDEVAIRMGPLSEPRYKQLKALAQSVFTIIRNTNRCPNGRVFTTRAVSVAYEKPGLASRGVKWSSSLSRIANAYTTWGIELVGQNPAAGEGRTSHKLAVLTLAAILADHIR